MAAKKSKDVSPSSVLEELDKALYEGKWQDVSYSLKKMSKKKSVPEVIRPFIQALEYIEDYTMERRTRSLNEIEELLKTALDLCRDEDHSLIRVLIQIKQGQMAWINNEMSKALETFPEIQPSRVDNAPIHTSKLYMESSLYIGLCIEVLYSTDDTSKCNMAMIAYEEALRISLEIAGLSKTFGLLVHPSVFRCIRTSLERGPILCIKLGNPLRGAGFFRRVLMTKEEYILPQIRQICATSLSICLLFLVSSGTYSPFTFSQMTYTPSQLSEELILTTSLSKTFLGTLSDTRIVDASALFDIITLVLTDARLPGILVQTLEDSMPYTSAGPHLWLQFALALVSNNMNQQAEAVFHECVRLFPKDPHIVLTASKSVLELMKKPDLSRQWIENGLVHFSGHFLEPKIYFILGESQAMLAQNQITYAKQQVFLKESLSSFKHAMELDPQNVELIFRYGVQLAIVREISAAMHTVQQALALNHEHTGCLHLLALLLSSNKQYAEALKICELALVQDSNNLNLIQTKIKLQTIVQGPHQALQSCKQALNVWLKLYSDDNSGLIGAVTQDQHSLSDVQSKAINRDDVAYMMSPDILSDTGSSHFSLSTSPTVRSSAIIQAQIWCTIANVFIKCKKYSDASLCVQEAQFLASYLPVVSITNGHVLECEGQPELAMDQYHNALVLKPYNVTALICIGKLLYLNNGKAKQAEKHLREALSVDRLNHEGWYWLGKIFTDLHEHERASDCFKTALQFESTCPVQKFETSLHRDNLC